MKNKTKSADNDNNFALSYVVPLRQPKKEYKEKLKEILDIVKIKNFDDNSITIDNTLGFKLFNTADEKYKEYKNALINKNLEDEIKNNPLQDYSSFIYNIITLYYSAIDHLINKYFNIYKIYDNKKVIENSNSFVIEDFDSFKKFLSAKIEEYQKITNTTIEEVDKSDDISKLNKSLLSYSAGMNKLTKELVEYSGEKLKYPYSNIKELVEYFKDNLKYFDNNIKELVKYFEEKLKYPDNNKKEGQNKGKINNTQ